MKKIGSTLYKMDSKGKIREWSIYVHEDDPSYSVHHGQQGGQMQCTNVLVENGKNVGKKNETTPLQQCYAEASALYKKQITRKGYTENVPTQPPNLPMLAHKYNDYKSYVSWPAAVSIKIDGCLSKDALIKTKEFGYKTIKYIVENKLSCKVLSYNTKTKRQEYKTILNYFENRELNEEVQWYEIETEDGKTLKLTGNHKVFLPELNCWRRVDQLSGDENLMEIMKLTKIKSIKKISYNETRYDLEVEDNHNYYANNILVHNCRLIIDIKNGVARATSRTGNEVQYIDHILDELLALKVDITLDGELYTDKYPFEELISIVRKTKSADPRIKDTYFYAFDIISDRPYHERVVTLDNLVGGLSNTKIVPWYIVPDEDMMLKRHAEFVSAGYEGTMIRNLNAQYEQNKRSSNLLKHKDFETDEFEIIGWKLGKGKAANIPTFELITKDGIKFEAVPKGVSELREKYLRDAPSLIGQMATVSYFGYTEDGSLRFPIMLCVRNYE